LLLFSAVNGTCHIIHLPSLIIRQYFVRFLNTFKDFGVATLIGMVLARHFTVRFPDIVSTRPP
jgi:hypothetical protein